ncbi:Leucine-rich repeat receptor-like protein kinase [Seminavis robusta]|uniref:Leucine-rich repeat receptor-like protein kinase n=1 Tax=Seminavis robusta TaxID=568900 RepID=A0A9N8DP29_9STRA|nr:Leucine-rich repeat receptor-like protein kinase [Seminavis robusta]|eukprot:Sro269_g104110.1 Leucine-rich repeat receptor-like protein kinase (744) ;mRNA; r:68267-70584
MESPHGGDEPHSSDTASHGTTTGSEQLIAEASNMAVESNGSATVSSIDGTSMVSNDDTSKERYSEKPMDKDEFDDIFASKAREEPEIAKDGKEIYRSSGISEKTEKSPQQPESNTERTDGDPSQSPAAVGAFFERITNGIQPLPPQPPRGATTGTPGAYHEGPSLDGRGVGFITAYQNIGPTTEETFVEPNNNTRYGSSSSLIQARAVPEEEQVDGMVHAEPVDTTTSDLDPSQSESTWSGKRRSAHSKYHKMLVAALVCLVLGSVLTVIGVLVSRNNKRKEDSETLFLRTPTMAPTMLTSTDYLWNILPEATQQSIDLQLIVAQDEPPAASTTKNKTYYETPQTQAFQWLIEDAALWNYSSTSRLYQRFALATLYYATQGKLWHDKANWLDYNQHECDWFAANEFRIGGPPVLADSPCGDGTVNKTSDGIFKRLWLPDNNLNGTFPSNEIYGMLTNLESINLFKNPALTGSAMSSQIGQLSNLSMISFSICAVSGTVPSEIGLLSSSLEIMYFSKIKQWTPAATSKPHNRLISGMLPTELGLLTALKHLSFNNNFLSGTLPTELGALPSLELFQIPGNNVTGSFPSELGQTRLLYLYVYDNRMTGVLPTELGLLRNMTHAHLYHNSFQGRVPSQVGALTSMKELMLAGNSLHGSMPSELANLSALRMLYLAHNPEMTGSFPTQLYNLSKLEALDFNETSIYLDREVGNISAVGRVPQHIHDALNFSFWDYYYKCFRRFPCPA